MEENNLQQSQEQTAAAGGQQPAAEQVQQNLQANAYGQSYTAEQAAQQNPQANAYGQSYGAAGQAAQQNPQANVYGQSYTAGQAAQQNPQANVYGQPYAAAEQAVQQNPQAYAYGQQPVQPQSPYLYGAPVQQAQAGGGKKKKKGLVAAIVLVAVIVAAIGIGVAVHASMSRSPQARLAKGFENLAEEMYAGERAVLADVDYPAIAEAMRTEGGSLDLSLNFTMPGEDTIGFDYIQNYDHANKLMSADFIVSAYNVSLAQMNLAADEDRLYFGMPGIISNTYYINADNFGEEYNASVWRELLGVDGLDDDYALDLFPEAAKEDEAGSGGFLGEDIKKLAEGITIENSKDTKEIEVNGKTVRCSGISVTIDKEVMNDFLEELEKELAASGQRELTVFRFKKDVKLTFYLDNKDRIVCIETAEKMKLEDSVVESIEFTFVLSGKERTVDEIFGNVEMVSPDDTIYMDITGESELTAAVYESEYKIVFSDEAGNEGNWLYDISWDMKNKEFEANWRIYDENETLSFEILGGFEDIEKGKSATFRLGQLKVLLDEEEICRFSGAFTIGPLTDKIEMPSEAVNFMTMSQEEIFGLINEIYENIMNSEWDDPWGVSPL